MRAAAPRGRRGGRAGARRRCRSTRAARAPICSDAAAGDAAVLSPAHQFPTGVVLHPDRRAAAIAWATATGGLIVEDDYDGELRYDRQPVGALQALAPGPRRLRRHRQQDARTGSAPGLAGRPAAPARADRRACAPPRTSTCRRWSRSRSASLLRSGAYERHVRRMRARYRARRDRLVAHARGRARPRSRRSGSQQGSGCCSSCPMGVPTSAELIDEAARRSLELFPLDPHYRVGPRAARRHRHRLRRTARARRSRRVSRALGDLLEACVVR